MSQTLERLKAPIPDRIWMFCVMCGAGLFVAGFAPTALVLMYLAWNRRERLVNDLRSGLTRNERYIPGLILLAPPVASLMAGGTPPLDDLLRHVAAHTHGFNYQAIYIGLDPAFPQVSMWFGFEVIAGTLKQAIGYWPAVYVLQATCYALSAWLAAAIAFRLIPVATPARTAWVAILVTALLVSGLIQRASLARPEAFLAVWAISALVLKPYQWLGLGLILMPAYWLSIIYLPAVLLLNASIRTKALIGAVLAATFLMFWASYAGQEWSNFFLLLAKWSSARLAPPGELLPIQAALFNPIFLLAIGAAIFKGRSASWDRSDLAILLVIGWFLLPGQVRYVGIIGPLLIILAARKIPLEALTPTIRALCYLLCASLLYGAAPTNKHQDLPSFSIPPGSSLLTEFDVPTYLMPSLNPGIKTTPAMDLGAVIKELQVASLALSGVGTLDCEILRKHRISHVIERSLKTHPACLQNPEFHSNWRMWHVHP